jgi:hypothetical protein
MELEMKILTKTVLGAALVAGSALAASAPASAQPYHYGDGAYGRYGDGVYGRYDDGFARYDQRAYRGGNWRSVSYCTSPRFGRWHFDPMLQRRVFVPHRWAVRSGYLRDCMYVMNRYGANRYGVGGWYR